MQASASVSRQAGVTAGLRHLTGRLPAVVDEVRQTRRMTSRESAARPAGSADPPPDGAGTAHASLRRRLS